MVIVGAINGHSNACSYVTVKLVVCHVYPVTSFHLNVDESGVAHQVKELAALNGSRRPGCATDTVMSTKARSMLSFHGSRRAALQSELATVMKPVAAQYPTELGERLLRIL